MVRGLGRAAARASQRDRVARAAAGELLDRAAAHCFVDPVAAADVVRWNQLRHRAGEVRARLAEAPDAFGALRLQAEAPGTWARLPEPRHEHVPAWARFRAAAEAWLDVQEGAPWTPPAEFPPPPPAPALAPGPGAPLRPRDAPPYGLPPLSPHDEPYPFGRKRSRGLSL